VIEAKITSQPDPAAPGATGRVKQPRRAHLQAITREPPMTDLTELTRYFQDLESQDTYAGVVLITRGDAEICSGAYGYASRAWKVRNTLDTRFDTASITKLFTAVATLQMIDREQISFDTRVIPFLKLNGTAISENVTVFHLLTHSSGIGDDADEEAGESYEEVWRTRPNYSVTEAAEFLPQFIHKPSNFPPGQGCRYCNCGFVLLGLLIEQVSGMSYRDYVRQHVFARAGMARSDFLRMDRVHEDLAEGCDPLRDEAGNIVGWKRNIYSYPPIGSPDGGAHVTARDLDRFLRSVKAGELLSPDLTARFFTPQVVHRAIANGTERFGFGIEFHVDEAGQVVSCQKDGLNAGVSGIIRHYPRLDVNVVLLSNLESGVWKPVRRIDDMVVNGRLA
jgi:CubicO group peptidase (beta-lactamase class C family)